MQIRVLFFGMLKDIVGRNQDELDVPEGSSVADVLARYELRFPSLRKSLPSVAVAVNQQYAGREHKLKAGDEIALLPPVSGGARPLG
jgi:molybdopterin converting factor subunit 1